MEVISGTVGGEEKIYLHSIEQQKRTIWKHKGSSKSVNSQMQREDFWNNSYEVEQKPK